MLRNIALVFVALVCTHASTASTSVMMYSPPLGKPLTAIPSYGCTSLDSWQEPPMYENYLSFDHASWTPEKLEATEGLNKAGHWYLSAQRTVDLASKYRLLVSAACSGHELAMAEAGQLLLANNFLLLTDMEHLESGVKASLLTRLNQPLTTSASASKMLDDANNAYAKSSYDRYTPDASYAEIQAFRKELKKLLPITEEAVAKAKLKAELATDDGETAAEVTLTASKIAMDEDTTLVSLLIRDLLYKEKISWDKPSRPSLLNKYLQSNSPSTLLGRLYNLQSIKDDSDAKLNDLEDLLETCLNDQVLNELCRSLYANQCLDEHGEDLSTEGSIAALQRIQKYCLIATLLGNPAAAYDYQLASLMLKDRKSAAIQAFLFQYASLITHTSYAQDLEDLRVFMQD
jgi:hypothetical protein